MLSPKRCDIPPVAALSGLDRPSYGRCPACWGEKTVLDQDQGRWLTYAEAGQKLAISPEAVRQLARRRGWPRRTPNAYGIPAKVLVPDDAPVRPHPGVDAGQPPYERSTAEQQVTGLNRPDESSVRAFEAVDMIRIIRETMEGLVAPLREQLDRERARADRAETALADAVAAERIAASEAVGLRAEVERLTAESRRPWWRRWFR